MKNSFKNLALIFLVSLSSVLMYSCQKESNINANSLSDDQLIEAIQSSTDKSAIIENDLPESSQSIIEFNYYESYTSEAFIAPELGYEVELRKGKGSRVGELHYTYFDTNGRELSSVNYGNQQKGGKGKQGKGKARMGKDCFSFELPITLTMPDESTIIIEADHDWASVKAWYEANADIKERPSMNFPVNVVYEDGSVVTVANDEDLKVLHEECRDNMRVKCFEMVYPVTFLMPDETQIVVSDRGDRDAIKAWYEGNPEIEEKPDLVYPVEVVLAEGDTTTISTDEEMLALKKACKETKKFQRKCFHLVFPVTVTMPDSTTITVESRADWITVKEWVEANPEVEDKPILVFPVDVIYMDGTTLTVNSQEEMDALKEACKEERQEKRCERRHEHGNGNNDRGPGHGQNGQGGKG